MASTPHGKQGYFYEAFLNKSNRYKVFHISSEEVIKNRPINACWTKEKREGALRLLKEEREDMIELQYSQEYLGLFLDDLRQYFPDELIEKVCVLKHHKQKLSNNMNFMGVDIARMGEDKITYEILHKVGNHSVHVENIVKEKQLTTETEKDILGLNRLWNLNYIGIDAGSGSLGVGIFDRLLANKETKRKVIAMNNRSIPIDKDGKKKQRIFKEDMYDNMLAMMEKGELLLLDDENVRLSLKSIQWELTDTQITKVRIFGRDNHICEGLVRAAWLAQKQKINKLWISCI